MLSRRFRVAALVLGGSGCTLVPGDPDADPDASTGTTDSGSSASDPGEPPPEPNGTTTGLSTTSTEGGATDEPVDEPGDATVLGEALTVDLAGLPFEPLSLEIGDFDGDGVLDLLITGTADGAVRSATLLGHGDGTFAAPLDNGMVACSAYPVVGRLSDDVRDDVLIAGCNGEYLATLVANPDATLVPWAPWPQVYGSGARSAIVGDFEGDGDNDVVMVAVQALPDGDAWISLFESNGGTGFWGGGGLGLGPIAQSGFEPNRLVAGHFDGDDVLDVALTDQGHDIARWFGVPGGFAFGLELGVELDPWSTLVGDLDGDGVDELVVTSYLESSLQVLANDGSGEFTPTGPLALAHAPYDAALADLDGDGLVDLVTVDDSEAAVRWLSGDGSGGLGPGQLRALPSPAIRVHAADLDGDGHADLAAATFAADSVSVILSGP